MSGGGGASVSTSLVGAEVGPVGPTSVEFGGSVVGSAGPVGPVGPVVGEVEWVEVSVDGAVLVSDGAPDVVVMGVVGTGGVVDGVGPDVTGSDAPTPGRVGAGNGAVGGNGVVGLPGPFVNPEVSSELVTSPMSVVSRTSPPPAE